MLRVLKDRSSRPISKKVGKKKTASVKDGRANGQLVELEPDDRLPRGYLSVSQINMYQRCPKQYEYRYIDGIKSPPTIALKEGSTHHDVMEAVGVEFMKKRIVPVKTRIEMFCDLFSTHKKDIDKKEWAMSGCSPSDVLNRGALLIEDYYAFERDNLKHIRPASQPEEKFEILIGGVPVLGFIDTTTLGLGVIDYKVVSKCKSQSETDHDLQLTIYSAVKKNPLVGFMCFVKSKTPKVQLVQSRRSQKDFRYSKLLVSSVADAIKKGAFPLCSPTGNYLCNERWCGYWKMCRGKGTGGRR